MEDKGEGQSQVAGVYEKFWGNKLRLYILHLYSYISQE